MNPSFPSVSDYTVSRDGTHFKNGTPAAVVEVLERARINRFRIEVVYQGDSVPEYGRVGRSTGPALRVPVLLYNARSSGGGEISTTIIREIRTSNGKQLLYQAAP